MNLFRQKKSIRKIPPHDLELLTQRVSLLAADDPLWPRLIALARANLKIETEAIARAAIGDEEAHRGRGRIGAWLEMEQQLNDLWKDSHKTD